MQAETSSPRRILPKDLTKWLCVAILSDLLIYVCYRHTLLAPGDMKWNAWAYSDWLINYSGGFIRRGLAGQIISLLAAGHPAAPIVNLIVFVSFTLLVFATSLLLILSRPLTAFAALLMMLIPGGLWSMQFGNEIYYRKELSFYVYIALICLLYLISRKTRGRAADVLDALNCVVIVIFSVLLSFVHEAFLFIGAVPSMVILHWIALQRWPSWRQRAPLLYGAAMVALFAFLLAFKGDKATVSAIWQGLNSEDRALISETGHVSGGISAIGWGPIRELAETSVIVFKGTAWYYLLAIAASLAYVLATVRFFCAGRGENTSAVAWTAKIYALCIASIAPLFILGADWGRWIAAVNMMTVPLICAGEFKAPLPVRLSLEPRAVIERIRTAKYLGFACGVFLLLIALTFRIPECCLVGSGDGFGAVELRLLTSAEKALLDRNGGS